mmetsp:Transcript_33348/g.65547  ORF Transcript_33348/g.65547 Transcript_33348/m.65547 type:complete len:1035 (-) Transcript_33348:316-3420(-)
MLQHMVNNFERIMGSGEVQSDELIQRLDEVHEDLVTLYNGLEQDGNGQLDPRNDVDALLEFRRHRWDFTNSVVDAYRVSSKSRNHSEWVYSDWHMPQFITREPVCLPPSSNTVEACIALPSSAFNGQEQETAVTLTTESVFAVALSHAYSKVKSHASSGGLEEYVLKAKGLFEYFLPEVPVFDYSYVRQCVRDGKALDLVLVPKPGRVPEAQQWTRLKLEYEAKICNDLVIPADDSYQDLKVDPDWEKMELLPVSAISTPFRVRLVGCNNVSPQVLPALRDFPITHISVTCYFFHGTNVLEQSTVESRTVPVTSSPRWLEDLLGATFLQHLLVNALPRETRIAFFLNGKNPAMQAPEIPLAWVSVNIIDEKGFLLTDRVKLNWWPCPGLVKAKHGKAPKTDPNFIFRQTSRDNHSSAHPCTLTLEFDAFALPVVSPLQPVEREPNINVVGLPIPQSSLKSAEEKKLTALINADALYELTSDDKGLVWRMRHALVSYPSILPFFLQSVNWGSPDCRQEGLNMLKIWAPQLSAVHWMALLDAKYPDCGVRSFVVEQLRRVEDSELQSYLLQLTQCLKFENYHNSALSRFLIERAIRSPLAIGHYFFWHLKAEMHTLQHAERFGVVLEEYLSQCGRYAHELRKQNNVVLKLQRVAAMIIRLKREEGNDDELVKREYSAALHRLNKEFFEPMVKFRIPLDPKWEATTLIVEKCRYMSSKMVPLWLVFRNADTSAPPLYIMFKSGDDLRQDILTLQMLRAMDKMWLADGLDMKMSPYRCIATGVNDNGEGVGMIEIVQNSDTTSGIQLDYGGGAMGALKLDPINQFIQAHNQGPSYQKAVQNFICSCAGYCVATFVLGIGDRHNGNIMVKKDGHLFHIDFGHFLGNFKKKFGVNRERAAFVFTPEMAYVMGGKRYRKDPNFKKFLSLCSSGFETLRKNAAQLEILFMLMVSAGMPELMVESDIHYLRDKLHLNLKKKAADKQLHLEINKSLDSYYRRFDNMIHNFKHGGGGDDKKKKELSKKKDSSKKKESSKMKTSAD